MQEWQDLTEKQPRYRLDEGFYQRVRGAHAGYKQVDDLLVPPGEGRALVVGKGHTFRVIEETGPQIGTVAFWNAQDRRESFLAARTWAHEGIFVRPFARLLSGVPWVRPMMTCVDQTVATQSGDGEYQHHTLGTHCSPEVIEMWFGREARNSCRQNLLRAVEPYGLTEVDLHDNLNVHQKAKVGDPEKGRIYLAASEARAGDYIEFFTEMDLLVAVSVCPLGDGTADPTRNLDDVRPLRMAVYDTGLEPESFPPSGDWRPTWKGRWSWPEAQGPKAI